ncbi:MAG TPA: hypothetical protein VNL17_04880 [Verrucomicrobiae bacterium]|nr:hypothetical protein [Verrucomicrobiae bacterium]
MPGSFSLEEWLSERSRQIIRGRREIVFEHPGRGKSLLLLRSSGTSVRWAENASVLKSIYSECDGGFIGGGYLLIGTPAKQSVATSAGVTIPTIDQIRSVSEQQGLVFCPNEIPFMTIGYMFVYTISEGEKLLCHDRDFHTVRDSESIREVLENWWSIKLADENNS